MKHLYFSSCDKSGGIYHYTVSGTTLCQLEFTKLDTPMHTCADGNKLYAVIREIDETTHFGGLISFVIGENGELTEPSEVASTKGIVPCYVSVLDGNAYYVNYLSGNVGCSDGSFDAHEGRGVNLPRQDMPHTHYVAPSPDGKYLFCCDLGLDTVFVYDKKLNVVSSAKVPEGAGARHIAASADGKLIYVVNELASSVTVMRYSDGKLTPLDTYPCIKGYMGQNTAAAVRVRGNYLFVSNRGADTITRFKIEGEKLTEVKNYPCGGMSPRDFDFAEDLLLCANETTNSVTVFKMNGDEPELTGTTLRFAHPICVTVADI